MVILTGRIFVGRSTVGSEQEAGIAAPPFEIVTIRGLVDEDMKQLLDRSLRIPSTPLLVPFHLIKMILCGDIV